MNTSFSIPVDKMIPITQARRNLGDLVDRLPKEKEFYLMRGGKIAAKLIAAEEVIRTERKKILDEIAGAWKGTDLDSDRLWNEILVKERIKGSKRKHIHL